MDAIISLTQNLAVGSALNNALVISSGAFFDANILLCMGSSGIVEVDVVIFLKVSVHSALFSIRIKRINQLVRISELKADGGY